MKPFHHASQDVKIFGGTKEDYLDIHEFIDSSYHVLPDVRHRALLHNQFGLMLVERLFGHYRTNSAGRTYSPRAVAENHILADLGKIPTVEQYFVNLTLQPWMSGTLKKRRVVSFNKGK
jgi:hypothetical protein